MLPTTVARITELCSGKAEGDTDDDHRIQCTGGSKRIGPFVHQQPEKRAGGRKISRRLPAGTLNHENAPPRTVIRVAEPRTAFAQVVTALHAPAKASTQIHPAAVIAISAGKLRRTVISVPMFRLENGQIGAGCMVGAGSVIGDDVTLGENSVVYGNVSIYDQDANWCPRRSSQWISHRVRWVRVCVQSRSLRKISADWDRGDW